MDIDSALLDALPDAFLVVRNDVVVWANVTASQMLDASAGGLVGHALGELLAPGERERLRLLETQRLESWDIPATCRLRFVRVKDRTEVATDVRFGHAARGDEPTLVLACRDMTETQRAEELMGRLAQLFARGGAMFDAGALLDSSEPIFEALGWRVAYTEVVEGGSITRRVVAPPGDPVGDYGRSIVDLLLPFDRTPMVAEVVRTGRPMFLDNVPTSLSGPPRNATELGASMSDAHVIRSAWVPVVCNGRLTHLLAVTGRNLTEHDFAAIQLFAAQLGAAARVSELRAELVQRERLAAVGEMAAVMAHEVRNPLGIIFNALAGLQRTPMATGNASELLTIIHEEAERLRRLVTDLLDFSRPAVAHLQSVPLVPIVREAIEAARLDPSCPTSLPQVALEVPSNLAKVLTDPLLLRRALVNLLVNAFQCVPAGGGVSVSASEVGLDVVARVHNDGPTIPPEIAARIFEPFFTTRATGTGLGLAVVQRILEQLAGRVELDASPSGTSFSLWLPTSGEGPSASDAPEAASPQA